MNHSSKVKTEIYNIINKCKKKMQENKTKAAPLYFPKGNIFLTITIVPVGMLSLTLQKSEGFRAKAPRVKP